MKISLYCPHCETRLDDISGKHALDIIKKYDTIVMGKPYTFRCVCSHDMHIIGAKGRYYNFEKVAEI